MKQVVRHKIKEANNVNDKKDKYILLIDGTNLLKISVVNTDLNNEKGECYGGVVNFLRMLGDILKKKDFDHCICVWDSSTSGILRWKLYNDYKANRDKHYEAFNVESEYDRKINEFVKHVINKSRGNKQEVKRGETDEESFNRQKMIVQQILEEVCIRQYELDDVEGDDILAYFVNTKSDDEKIVIVSSDKDLTQLINETVCVWNPRKKEFITNKNSKDILGITHENIVLEKIFCGDSSDNIYGIKGMGEATFRKYFPEMVENKGTVEAVIALTESILNRRKEEKKKPLKTLENVLNKVTDGIQGDRIYEINKAIIDLSVPLLTEDAMKVLESERYAPLDTENRTLNNVYQIINDNGMVYLQDENNFGNIFGSYNRICETERQYQKANK